MHIKKSSFFFFFIARLLHKNPREYYEQNIGIERYHFGGKPMGKCYLEDMYYRFDLPEQKNIMPSNPLICKHQGLRSLTTACSKMFDLSHHAWNQNGTKSKENKYVSSAFTNAKDVAEVKDSNNKMYLCHIHKSAAHSQEEIDHPMAQEWAHQHSSYSYFPAFCNKGNIRKEIRNLFWWILQTQQVN